VLLVDLAQARFGAPAVTQDAPFSLRDARLSFLASGDRHDLRSGVTTPSARKLAGTRLDPAAPGFKGYYDNDPFYPDILGDNTLVTAMCNLIDNRRAEALGLAFSAQTAAVGPDTDPQPDLGFEFRLRKGAGSLGWLSSDNGDGDCSVVGLLLDVRPVRMARPLYRDFDPQPPTPPQRL
jgi:cyanophycinase